MFEDFILSLEKASPKHKQFGKDLIQHIENGLSEKARLIATHGFCTDGGVAGAMIKYSDSADFVIPMDYDILKNPEARKILVDLNWEGIVDLEPFNKKRSQWYVDHHLSTVGKQINSTQIRFDSDGDSGAYQLLLSSFLNEFPEHIVELAVMTRTTDTAGYISEPPIEKITDLTQLDLQDLTGKEGIIANERRIWLLDDAWGSVTTLKDHLKLHTYLAKDGFYGLNKVLNRINERRSFRETAVNIADKIELDSDIIIFTYQDETVDKFSIDRRLQKRGAKVTISMNQTKQGVKLSFRRNKHLTEEENQKIQLNELAGLMNGGGHAGASGGFMPSLEEAIEITQQWSKTKGLSYNLDKLN